MPICESSEFWTNFCANAFSDILFGVLFGTVFGIISTRLITAWLDRRSRPDLYITARESDSGKLQARLRNWPPIAGRPATADLQIIIENRGRVAAANWLLVLILPRCDTPDGKPLIRLHLKPDNPAITPLIEVRHESSIHQGQYILRLQYATPADVIHSGYKALQPPFLGLEFHTGFENVMNGFSGATYLRKTGRYEVYADNMKTREGEVSLAVSGQDGSVSLGFYVGDYLLL